MTLIKINNQFNLSDEELETLDWLSKGKTYKEIAAISFLGVSTITHRVVMIHEKMGTANTAGAVGLALRSGALK